MPLRLYERPQVANILDEIMDLRVKEKDPVKRAELSDLWEEIYGKYNEMESLDAIEIDW